MKLLLYCTKAKPYLVKRNIFAGVEPSYFTLKENVDDSLNGKIVAECDFEVEEIEYITEFNPRAFAQDEWFVCKNNYDVNLLKESCLSITDLCEYFKNTLEDDTCGYAIHIKNLHIFDKPKELDYYYSRPKKVNTLDGYSYVNITLDKAPQNMMYCCTESGKDYILISIKPEWLCKILNNEKTIEIRRKVLREMIK